MNHADSGHQKNNNPPIQPRRKDVTNLWRISWKTTNVCLEKTPRAESRNSKDSNQFPEKSLRLWCLTELQLQQSMSSKCAGIQPTQPLLRFFIFACWTDQETFLKKRTTYNLFNVIRLPICCWQSKSGNFRYANLRTNPSLRPRYRLKFSTKARCLSAWTSSQGLFTFGGPVVWNLLLAISEPKSGMSPSIWHGFFQPEPPGFGESDDSIRSNVTIHLRYVMSST